MLPDRSVLIGQKLVKNAKTKKEIKSPIFETNAILGIKLFFCPFSNIQFWMKQSDKLNNFFFFLLLKLTTLRIINTAPLGLNYPRGAKQNFSIDFPQPPKKRGET